MSDDKKPSLFPPVKLLLLAAVAGLAVGAAAVYISGRPDGNIAAAPATQQAANAAGESQDDLVCQAQSNRGVALAEKAKGQVAAMGKADPPRSLKTLAFNDPTGKPMSVADLKGKIVLMNLWATWCAPCRAEMPELDEIQHLKGSDKFEVVAVNVDTGDDTKPKKFLEETAIKSLGYYRDNTLGIFNDLKRQGLALGLPVTLLIDKDGCLLASMNGPAAWASDDAKTLIDAALAD